MNTAAPHYYTAECRRCGGTFEMPEAETVEGFVCDQCQYNDLADDQEWNAELEGDNDEL